MKRLLWIIALLAIVTVASLYAGANYLLNYSLSRNTECADTSICYARLAEQYPAVKPWVDSVRACGALRDTFAVMPSGERHHALLLGGAERSRTAVLVHGWRRCGIDMLHLARVYYEELGFRVILPDLHGHGLSEGEMIQMGWLDRLDVHRWMEWYASDTMVVHGVSMGGATTMMLSSMPAPEGVSSLRFVEDCGYTSVRDIFTYQLDLEFGLPPFPLLNAASALCRWRYGWSFDEASALEQVKRCRQPMLLIHGDSDTFVPSPMVNDLYAAKPEPKALWITKGAEHNRSYMNYPVAYADTLRAFVERQY